MARLFENKKKEEEEEEEIWAAGGTARWMIYDGER